MKKESQRHVIPEVNPVPDNLPSPADYASIPVDQVDDYFSFSRTRRGGECRLTVKATEIATEAIKTYPQYAPLHPWGEIIEGLRNGSWYLVPTNENNPRKIRLRWIDAGNELAFSLNKVLKAKGVHVPRGQAMVMDCYEANVPGYGAGVELRRSEARFVDLKQRAAAK